MNSTGYFPFSCFFGFLQDGVSAMMTFRDVGFGVLAPFVLFGS
jgi:hypothetical protein